MYRGRYKKVKKFYINTSKIQKTRFCGDFTPPYPNRFDFVVDIVYGNMISLCVIDPDCEVFPCCFF